MTRRMHVDKVSPYPFALRPPAQGWRPFVRAAAFAALLFVAGCSLPRIVVLTDPLTAEEHVRLGGIYASQGKDDLARDQYKAAIQRDGKSVRAWERYGDLSFRMQDYREAEKAYAKAVDLEPQNGDHCNNLAWVYAVQDKRLARAEELVGQALSLTPAHRPYYLDTLGVILRKRGKTGEAVAAHEESVVTIPAEQTALLAEAYLHLSEAYAAAGEDARAHDARERHLRLRAGAAVPP